MTAKCIAAFRTMIKRWRVADTAGAAVIDESEFINLLETHKDEFYRFIHRNIWNTSDSDDVFSEAVMVAWKKRTDFEKGTNFRAWFYRILLNKSFVFNRHTGREPTTVDDPDSSEVAETEDAFGNHSAFDDPKNFLDNLGDEIIDALKTLRKDERICLCLRAMDECSYKEIAEIMDIPIGTVMTHLSRSRKKMKKLLLATG